MCIRDSGKPGARHVVELAGSQDLDRRPAVSQRCWALGCSAVTPSAYRGARRLSSENRCPSAGKSPRRCGGARSAQPSPPHPHNTRPACSRRPWRARCPSWPRALCGPYAWNRGERGPPRCGEMQRFPPSSSSRVRGYRAIDVAAGEHRARGTAHGRRYGERRPQAAPELQGICTAWSPACPGHRSVLN